MFKDQCLNALVQLNNVRPEDVMKTDEQTRALLLSHCRRVIHLIDKAERGASQALETKAERSAAAQ